MQPAVTSGWGIVALGAVAGLLLTAFVQRAARAPALQTWARWFNPILVATWVALAWLATRRLLEADSTVQVAARAVVVLAVIVLFAPLLRDLFAAAVISLEGRHRVGDDIRVAGLEGRVVALGLRTVVLSRRDGSECAVPNGRFVAAEVVRLNHASGQAPCEFDVRVPAGRGVDAATAEVVRAALLSPFAAPGSLPEVFVTQSDGSELSLRVRAYVFDRLFEERYRSDILARLAERD